MVFAWIASGLLFSAAFGYGLMLMLRGPIRRSKRRKIIATPFPFHWVTIIDRHCAFYDQLTLDLQERLKKHVQVFLAEKQFEACGDLDEVTDEMRVVIAAQACLLLIGLKRHDYFRELRSILVYPGAYHRGRQRLFFLSEEESVDQALLGESWESGSVIVA